MEYHWALRCLPALLWPLLLGSGAFELHLRSNWYASYLFERLHVYEAVPDADALHAAVYACYYGETTSGAVDKNSAISGEMSGKVGDPFAGSRFGTYERLHFHDVSRLLSWNRVVCVVSLLLLLILSIRYPLRYQWMRIGACFVLAGLFAVILMSSRWLLLFRGLHPLLFSHGHWDFHPNDLILQLYPELLLGVVAASILISVLFMTFVLYVIGWHFDKTALFQGFKWRWQKRYTDFSLVVALFLVPAWISGREMIAEGCVSWQLYWLLCTLLIAACLSAVVLRNLALSLFLIAAAFLGLQSFAEGVANSTLRAQYCLEVIGGHYRDAIERYKAIHHHVPANIEQVRIFAAEYEDPNPEDKHAVVKNLPLRFDQFGPWHYEVLEHGHYSIFFTGPLAFEFSYHSASDYWNSMRRP